MEGGVAVGVEEDPSAREAEVAQRVDGVEAEQLAILVVDGLPGEERA